MKRKIDNKEDKTIRNIVFVVVILFIIIFAYVKVIHPYFKAKNSNNFEFVGIPFIKEVSGEVTFYTASIPIYQHKGPIRIYKGNISLDFRNDPRELVKQVNISGEKILFNINKTIYVTTPKDLPNCEGDLGLALVNQGRFLGIIGINVNGSYDDKEYANQTKFPYATCENNPNNTVIYLKQNNETKIEISNNCFILEFKDCEILKATERFQFAILEQYSEYENLEKK